MQDSSHRHAQTRIQACAFRRVLVLTILLLALPLFGRISSAMEAAREKTDWPTMLLFHVNEVRQQNGRPPVRWNAQLAAAAQAHARDLQSCSNLSHTGCDGSELRQRLDRAGYAWRMAAENLALCTCDAAQVVALWMESEGHRRNLLSAEAHEIGAATLPDGKGHDVWVLVLGRLRVPH